MALRILAGIRVVSLALNVPGPVAASRMASMGAEVIKLEPPTGDLLESCSRSWYASLVRNQQVVKVDLKRTQGQRELTQLLSTSDLIVISFRPAVLRRLGLTWEQLHSKYPQLCAINIIGYTPPNADVPGHDLTYAAKAGLIRPGQLPTSLYVDLAGAERVVSAAFGLLHQRTKTGEGQTVTVSLFETAEALAEPIRAGLTTPAGELGGGRPFYGLYRCKRDSIAVAALEDRFAERLRSKLNLGNDRAALQERFLQMSADAWERWATENDIPIVKVHEIPH